MLTVKDQFNFSFFLTLLIIVKVFSQFRDPTDFLEDVSEFLFNRNLYFVVF